MNQSYCRAKLFSNSSRTRNRHKNTKFNSHPLQLSQMVRFEIEKSKKNYCYSLLTVNQTSAVCITIYFCKYVDVGSMLSVT